jgi:hypothetical protein
MPNLLGWRRATTAPITRRYACRGISCMTILSSRFGQSHRRLQQAMRKFHDEVIYPDAQAREEDGKRPSSEVIRKMAYVISYVRPDT